MSEQKFKFCKHCKIKFFKRYKSSYKQWENSLFCSPTCSNRYNKPFLGKHHTYNTKQKQREFKIGKLNPMWKGNNVGYHALHSWVRRNLRKPLKCVKCKNKPPYDVANKSGKYKRNLKDWDWSCRKCHMESDNRIFNLKQYKNKEFHDKK